MRYLKDSGFVVKRTNFGEHDRYVTFFTRNNGKIEVLAKGVRKITSKRLSHLELMNNLRFQAVKGAKNYVLAEVEMISSYDSLRRSLQNCKQLFFISELIENLCPINQTNESVYLLLNDTLKTFLEDKNFSESLRIKFQTKLLSLLGYWDNGRVFKNESDILNYVESIIERRLKTNTYFKL